MMRMGQTNKPIVGWREWVALPELGIDLLKAKVDTGARTSALHAFSLDVATEGGVRMARFGVHPIQHDRDTETWCSAPVVELATLEDLRGLESGPILSTCI